MEAGAGTVLAPEQILLVRVGGERYGVPLGAVREIVRAVAITPLPGAPRVVEGVIDVRGQVVPVLNLRRRFGHPEKPLDPSERIVLVHAGERPAALRVDEAEGLADLVAGAVEDARAVTPGAEHVAGVAKLADGVVLIHDPAAFLSQAEAAVLDEAMAE
jgi:purine-binding chemotaxis protein CheW